MASLGSGSVTTLPTTFGATGYTPYPGSLIAMANVVEVTVGGSGGGGGVDPKRYLNVAGTAVPIQ